MRNVRVLEGSQKQSSVEYQKIGCTVTLRAKRLNGGSSVAPARIELELNIQVSSLVLDGPVAITEGLKAPIFVNYSQSQSVLLRLGETILLTSFDAPEMAPGSAARGTTLIWRVSVDQLD